MTHPNGHALNSAKAGEKVRVLLGDDRLRRIKELAHRIEYGSPMAPQHAREIRELVTTEMGERR